MLGLTGNISRYHDTAAMEAPKYRGLLFFFFPVTLLTQRYTPPCLSGDEWPILADSAALGGMGRILEPLSGFEPETFRLQGGRSTN